MVSPTQAALADWDLAARIAWSVASGPLASRVHADRVTIAALRADIDDVVRDADRLARLAAGLGADLSPATAHVLGRRAWIQSNLDSLAELTAPVAEQLHKRRGGGNRRSTRRVLAVQIGVVFGYLSTRVLGQYEVFTPGWRDQASGEPAAPGRLVLVGPNLLELEAALLPEVGITAHEFRLGVCLHEIAHRLQFEAVPWTRPLLRGLLEAYLEDVDFDPDRVREIARGVPELLRDPSRLREPRALLELVLTPGQREVLDRAQALMSLLEGHGNAVMDWGAEEAAALGEHAVDPSRVREVLNRRRGKTVNAAVQKALGLSMKSEQYAKGERFILDVARDFGRETFNKVWRDAANVPSAEEIADPASWVARINGTHEMDET